MKRIVLILTLGAALLNNVSPAMAGWWHRHHGHHHAVYQSGYASAPQYYMMQAPAPQSSPLDAVLPLLVDRLLGRLEEGRGGGRLPPSRRDEGGSGGSSLAELKDELMNFRSEVSETLENTNSTLTRHGKELVELRLDVKALSKSLNIEELRKELDIEGLRAKFDAQVGPEGDLTKNVDGIRESLKAPTRSQMQAALKELVDKDLTDALKAANVADAEIAKVKMTAETAVSDILKQYDK